MNQQLFLSGYSFRPHVSGESGIRICSPEWKCLNMLSIWNRVDAKSKYFLCGDVTRSSSVLCRKYCIQDGNLAHSFSQGRARCKFCALYNACSVANIPRGVLSTAVNPDTCQIGVDRQIRFWQSFRPHQFGLGSNPGVNAICGLSLSLVLSLVPRCFLQVSLVFPPKNLHFQISNIQSGRHRRVSMSS